MPPAIGEVHTGGGKIVGDLRFIMHVLIEVNRAVAFAVASVSAITIPEEGC